MPQALATLFWTTAIRRSSSFTENKNCTATGILNTVSSKNIFIEIMHIKY